MGNIKITSPGVLLILAVIAAGSIFVVDVSYLRPYSRSMEREAILERAEAIWLEISKDLTKQERGMAKVCRAAATQPSASPASVAQAAPSLARLSDSAILVVADPTGVPLHVYRADDKPSWRSFNKEVDDHQLRDAIAAVATTEGAGNSGLLLVDDSVGIFARSPIRPAEQEVADQPAGVLWLIKPLFPLLPSEVNLILGAARPASRIDAGGTALSLNPKQDMMEIAWPAEDSARRSIGYFLTTTSIKHIRLRAASARKQSLLLLSLSAAMASLVFLSVHILIAGPVYRLMKRLRTIELGDDVPKDLTRDLHGEPLMLARRLESAFGRLAEMSRTDELTGLANRRHFMNVLDAFYAQSRRYNRPLSLIVMDVDFFKAINDTGGHEAGDRLLKTVAGAIESASRKADLPARLGGDEFAILLPETIATDAEAVAQRIRKSLSEQRAIEGLEMQVTLSIGISDLNAGEIDSPEAMQSVADRALYAAKENGRNRIVQGHQLQGISLTNGEGGEQVSKLYKKLAGLDSQFKDLFLNGIEEVLELLETRAPDMADHTHKVQHYAALIAREMGLSSRVVKHIEIAAMLHDIGMLAMPDSILRSEEKLTGQDLRLLRQHPLISVRIMEGMEFLEQEIPAVRYHHEWFNGSGYPEGISGKAIPLSARILSVADAFDSMTSSRMFRQAVSFEEAIKELGNQAGKQFDPDVVAAFCAVAERKGPDMLKAEESQAADHNNSQQAVSPPT